MNASHRSYLATGHYSTHVGGLGAEHSRHKARGRVSAALALVAGLAASGGLVSCADQEPQAALPASQTVPVTVGVDVDVSEQLVLGEIYAQGFSRVGRQGETVGLAHSNLRVQAVADGEVTMSFGCTGELLGILDPATAKQLAEEYKADKSPDKATSGEWKNRVYDAFSRALPGDVMATDPGATVGCGWLGNTEEQRARNSNPGAVLPQFVVPFYRKPALVREERVEVLNRVAGSLNTKDLTTMVERVRKGVPPAEVAGEWVTNSEFGG